LICIPKSSNPARIAQNAAVFGWDLPKEAMQTLNRLDCGFRCFISYLKKPDNDALWHDGRLEKGDSSDFV
jgi:diketogulonate reductase-like aldo/keto reductase